MKTLWLALPLLGVISLGSAACSVPLKAKAPVERPPLDVPPPPPRVIEPAPVPDAPPEPVPELPPAPAPTRPTAGNTRPQARPNAANATAEAKPEGKPEAAAASDTTPAPPPATPPSVPQLRTPQTADGSEAEKSVRTIVERAKTGLNTVNFNTLSNERKKAYNDAKAFIQASEEALKQNNYVLAQSLATKAETLAHELAGR